MKKSTKGAIAAAAAGVLLLGGAGTLAYWTDSKTVTGGTINSGHLALLTDGTNTGCDANWVLDSGEQAPQTYTAGDPLVPGDVLSKHCAFTIDASGNQLRATVAASTPSYSSNNFSPTSDISTAVSAIQVDDVNATEFTELDDTKKIDFDVTVTFNSGATANMDKSAVLNNITVTATQVHTP